MTKVVLPTNDYCEEKLQAVVEEMKELGSPAIRGHWDPEGDDAFKAIEGAHRLRACEHLGVVPVLDPVDPDTLVDDVEGLHTYYGEEDPTFVAEIGSWDNYSLKIGEW